MALPAPRILNEPIGCRFSSLSQIAAGAPSTFRRTSGVRSADPAMRAAAARMASRVGASIVRNATASEFDGDALSFRAGGCLDVVSGRQVLDRDAQGLE